VKAIEEATSSPLAPITGATAAMAELPQIALPQADRGAKQLLEVAVMLLGASISLKALVASGPALLTTVATMPVSRAGPEATSALRLIEAPSSITATSSTVTAAASLVQAAEEHLVHHPYVEALVIAILAGIAVATMPVSRAGPEATSALRLIEAPSSITATSSSCLSCPASPSASPSRRRRAWSRRRRSTSSTTPTSRRRAP
jgi:hypothetical protein